MRVELTAATNQTVINFAHAFDGYAYAKGVWHAAENAEQEVLLERLSQAQSSGRFYLEASDNFAINFYLHRGFHHSGSLPEPGSRDWLDMVFLYLHLYRLPIPVKYRHGPHADWARRPKGSAEDAAAEIRNTLRLRSVSASPRLPLEPNTPVSTESGDFKTLMSVLDDVQFGIKHGSTRLFRGWALGETPGPEIQSLLEMAGDNEDWQSIAVCCVVIIAIHKATGAAPGITPDGAVASPSLSTSIPYCLESQFFEPTETTIRMVGGTVASPLHVVLKPGGYAHDCNVPIRQSDAKFFQTDWKNKDPTRFSARNRAAATVLHRTGHEGRFRIRHEDGALTIVPT